MANLRVDKITSTETFETTGSVQFDGSGDFLTVADNADFNLGTGDFTLEAWVYHQSQDSLESKNIYSQRNDSENGISFRIRRDGTSNFQCLDFFYDNIGSGSTVGVTKVSLHTWHHVALTRKDGVVRIFLDGVLDATKNLSGVDFGSASGFGPVIGARKRDSDEEAFGFISNIRLIKGKALYTTNFKIPMRELEVTPETVLLACQSKTDATLEKTGKTITVNGNAVASELTPGLLTPVPKAGAGSAITGSVEFDGTGDYLDVTSSSDFTYGTEDFTIDYWAYFSSKSSDNYVIMDQRDIGVTSQVAPHIWFGRTDKGYKYYLNGVNVINGSNDAEFDTWHHFALVKYNNTTKIYVNGVQVGSYSDTNTYVESSSFRIGHNTVGTADMKGFISNFRVVKGTALYTHNFIPPTRELKKVPGTVLLCCQDPDNPLTEATGKTITGYGDLQRTDDIELITNGSFAGDFTGWTNGNPSQFVYSTNSVGGDTSGKVMYYAIDNNLRTFTQYVTCVTGQKYILSFDASSDTANAMVIDIDGTNVVTIDDNNNSALIRYNHVFTAGSTSVRIRIESQLANRAYFDNFSVKLVDGSNKGSNFTPQVGDDRKVTFEGVTKINSNAYFYLPTGDTVTRDSRSGRGLFGGGDPGVNTISYITIASMGNGLDFGDLSEVRLGLGSAASSTRAVFAGGYGGGNKDTIDFVTIATTGNAVSFGELVGADRHELAGASNSIRGLFAGGSPIVTDIDFVTIASTGNATDFGNLTLARRNATGVMSPTRAVFCGGRNDTPAPSTQQEEVDYVTIASTGNALDFGDLTVARGRMGSVCSSVRGVVGGGTDVIDYITIASTGNAQDFGDMINASEGDTGGCSNSLRGVFGGHNPSARNIMEYVTISSTGNSQDFGDLTYSTTRKTGCSNSHGGLG